MLTILDKKEKFSLISKTRKEWRYFKKIYNLDVEAYLILATSLRIQRRNLKGYYYVLSNLLFQFTT